MELHFQTKEESNKKQLEVFLNLSKTERFYNFLRLMEKVKRFPVKNKSDYKKDNFVINIKSN